MAGNRFRAVAEIRVDGFGPQLRLNKRGPPRPSRRRLVLQGKGERPRRRRDERGLRLDLTEVQRLHPLAAVNDVGRRFSIPTPLFAGRADFCSKDCIVLGSVGGPACLRPGAAGTRRRAYCNARTGDSCSRRIQRQPEASCRFTTQPQVGWATLRQGDTPFVSLNSFGSSVILVGAREMLVFQGRLKSFHEVLLSPSAVALASALRPAVEG